MEGVILLVIVGGLVLGGIIWKAKMSLAKSKPMHLREPIPKGCFRLAALDDLGDEAALSQAIFDYPTLEEALQEADSRTKEEELKTASKKNAALKKKIEDSKDESVQHRPTRFLVYNDKEEVMNPTPPPSGAQTQ